ncbi:hypothetical protein PhaeoP14_00676 [Phaeobacter piscinae]|nr:hypothetical protein PhaeoP14_00676 [Phaeobacter piscinae]
MGKSPRLADLHGRAELKRAPALDSGSSVHSLAHIVVLRLFLETTLPEGVPFLHFAGMRLIHSSQLRQRCGAETTGSSVFTMGRLVGEI